MTLGLVLAHGIAGHAQFNDIAVSTNDNVFKVCINIDRGTTAVTLSLSLPVPVCVFDDAVAFDVARVTQANLRAIREFIKVHKKHIS